MAGSLARSRTASSGRPSTTSCRTSRGSRSRRCSASSGSSAWSSSRRTKGRSGRSRRRARRSSAATAELNRYPDGGAYRLRAALAERFDLRFEEVAVGAGSDGLVDCLTPGRARARRRDRLRLAVVPELRDRRAQGRRRAAHGAAARRAATTSRRCSTAIGPRTKIAYVCLPNNPTGTTNTRAELDAWFERVPEHVVTVLDQAYAEYIDDPDYPDGVEEYLKQGRRVVVLRTFSKIYGLAGLRVGYGLAPAEIVTGIAKVRRAFDITTPAQEAALASLDSPDELERRRARERRRAGGARADPARARPRPGRARGRELPLRRGGRGLAPVLRAAAPRRRDRAADARLRRARRGARDGGHRRGARRSSQSALTRVLARGLTPRDQAEKPLVRVPGAVLPCARRWAAPT